MQLILFCGLPGSGKTTISRRLCEVINAKFIDLDDFKKIEVDPTLVRSQIDPPEIRWSYYQKGLCEAMRLFTSGIQNIIIDEVFHLAELRQRIEDFSEQNGISLLWVEVRCPYKVVEERLLAKPRVGHILSTEEALKMYGLFGEIFEPFAPDNSGHVLINNESNDRIDVVLTLILQRMG